MGEEVSAPTEEQKILNNTIKVAIDEPHLEVIKKLEEFDTTLSKLSVNRPTELAQYKPYLEKFNSYKETFKSFKFSVDKSHVPQLLTEYAGALTEKWMTERDSKYEEIDAQIEALREQIQNEAKAHNEAIKNANTQDNISYRTLETKRNRLLSYSDKIINLCSQYGLSTSDVNLSEDMFTPDTLNELYDEYIVYMEKESNPINPITKVRNLIPSPTTQGIILLILLALCFTVVLDAISIMFFGALLFVQWKNLKRIDYYTVLMGLTFNVNPMLLGFKDLDESLLLPEVLTDEMLDTDPRFAHFESLYDDIEAEYDKTDPTGLSAKLMNEYSLNKRDIDEKVDEYKKAFERMHACILSDIETEENALKELYNDLKSKFKTLGQKFSNHLYFDSLFTLGLEGDCKEEKVDLGLRNVIIRPSKNVAEFNAFIQCMVANAFCNVKPGSLKMYVYDPNNFGQAITPMYTSDLKDYFIFENSDLNNILDKLTEDVQNNFKDMSGMNIQDYNKMCEETGKTPKDYSLLLVLSQPKSIEEDEKLMNFFNYSASGGTFIWLVSDKMRSQDALTFRIPFEGVTHPWTIINTAWCKQWNLSFVDALSKSKGKALLWKDFVDTIFKDPATGKSRDLWYGNADKFIDFYPGFEDGDPSLFKPYTLGNEGNVHAIGVGTSGAGKSVFLNHLLGTMCRIYSPKELELWLCDFKGVEFKAYMKTPRAKAAKYCKPVKAEPNYSPRMEEKKKEVLGYYSYDEESKEYRFSKEPTADCNELHIFFQDIDKKTKEVKVKNGKPVEPYPKPDTEFKDNMESYCLPHIAACLCTSDGDFATSLFKAYRDKADARYEDMKILGVKNMPGWNDRVSSLIGTSKPQGIIEAHGKETGFNPIWSEDDIWPRVLFVCDEFQVIFQKADAKNVERIKADITQIAKVARACGMHIFFTSQSMKGTVSSDILANFSLRFALRCEPEVSNDIIGSTRAAEIKEKNGYLIVKSLEMKTAEDQKKYKTPFLSDDEGSGQMTTSQLFDNIRELYLLAGERGFKEKNVISYEEATKHDNKEMDDFFNDPVVKSKLPDSGVILLGPRMAYSENKAPDNCILGAVNNANIMSVFSDNYDIVLFFKQVMKSISLNEIPGSVVINSQVGDLSYLTDAEKYVTSEKHKYLVSEKVPCIDIITWAEKLLEHRKANGSKDKPVWLVLLGWDKGIGIGLDADYGLRARLNMLLQTAGEFNIHIIFINSGVGAINSTIIEACSVRICGKVSGDDSLAVIGTKQGGNNYDSMPNGYIFINRGGVVSRDKLYKFPIEREIAAKEIVI